MFLAAGGSKFLGEALDEAFFEHPGQWMLFLVIGALAIGLLVLAWISEWKTKIEMTVQNIETKVDAILERLD